jgi:hypothetical protein
MVKSAPRAPSASRILHGILPNNIFRGALERRSQAALQAELLADLQQRQEGMRRVMDWKSEQIRRQQEQRQQEQRQQEQQQQQGQQQGQQGGKKSRSKKRGRKSMHRRNKSMHKKRKSKKN